MTEVYSTLTLRNLRKIDVGGSGFLHTVLRNLVDAAQVRPMARAKFAMYRWKALERKATSKSLKDAIHNTLGYVMKNSEAEVILSRFRTHENTFDYSSFLISFLNTYDRSQPTTTCATTPMATPPVSPRRETSKLLRKAATRVTHVVAASKHLSKEGSEAVLRRAKQALEEALRVRIIKRIPDAAESVGNISRRSFRINMRSLYGVGLSEKEADALFNHLDTNHDGFISQTELTECIQSMISSIKAQLTTHNIVKRRIKRQASNCLAYDRQEFQRAVVQLTESLKYGQKFSLPEFSLPQDFVRKQIYEQLGVKLTRLQMQCLCYKLQRKLHDDFISQCTSMDSEATTIESYSTNASAASTCSIASVASEENMREVPIEGKIVEKFYYELQRFFGETGVVV